MYYMAHGVCVPLRGPHTPFADRRRRTNRTADLGGASQRQLSVPHSRTLSSIIFTFTCDILSHPTPHAHTPHVPSARKRVTWRFTFCSSFSSRECAFGECLHPPSGLGVRTLLAAGTDCSNPWPFHAPHTLFDSHTTPVAVSQHHKLHDVRFRRRPTSPPSPPQCQCDMLTQFGKRGGGSRV
jgi:hypothetical protein